MASVAFSGACGIVKQRLLCSSPHVTRLLLILTLSAGAAAPSAVYPLHVSANGLYLVDDGEKPFLITGDSAWSLIASLSLEDAKRYIEDRKARGFNTILVSLIEHKFTSDAPRNAYGELPFVRTGDFSTPNSQYFDRAEQIVRLASDAGMLVLLAPAYLGAEGGDEGWYQEMKKAGAPDLYGYGRYVGERFRKFSNIIWVQGGDYDPPDRRLVNAIAEGIQSAEPAALQTVHTNRDTSSKTYWQAARWLAIDTVYTYDNVQAAVLAHDRTSPARPFFLIEAPYENERGVTYLETQKNAYSALMSGASGQIFGNNPVWHFDGKGIYRTNLSWQAALASDGARSETHLAALFSGIAWWKLQPDDGTFLRNPESSQTAFAMAARAADGTLALVYMRNIESVRVDLNVLSPGGKRLRWFETSSGVFTDVGDVGPDIRIPILPKGTGPTDWILVVTAEASQ